MLSIVTTSADMGMNNASPKNVSRDNIFLALGFSFN